MISLDDALKIHQILIDKFGGTYGIRDRNALEASINRLFATFNLQDLYPGAIEKAAAILESILINHPFIDGNKRTGYVLMRIILLNHNFDLIANEEEKYKMVISVSKGELRFDGIKDWIEKYSKRN